MKKQILWMPLILMAMFATAAVSTRAQASSIRADVPFDFIVGDKTIPAGRITAHGVSTAVAGALTIMNPDQGETAQRVGRRVPGAERSNECKLVFHKYGNRYYLAQIWLAGYEGWSVMKSKEEQSLLEREQRLVKNFKPVLVALVAVKN